MLKRVLIWGLKGVIFWLPASIFWVQLAVGAPLLDLRTDEEVEDDAAEVKRLERFFDVEGLPEAEYLVEWQAKEEALSQMLEKILRSQRFMDCMLPGAFIDGAASEDGSAQYPVGGSRSRPASASRSSGSAAVSKLGSEASLVEVSYILPPPSYSAELGFTSLSTATGPKPWAPRFMLAHREGSLALIFATFEFVPRGKDREERWACTSLRADLVAFCDGEPACEPMCDLRGPVPHGIRYMRI